MPQQYASPLQDEKLTFLPTFAVFLLGLASGFPIQVVGKLYPGELILAVIGIAGFLSLFSMPTALRSQVLIFLGAMFVSLSGYILSDMHRGTATSDYLRGWAYWGFMILDFLALVKITQRQPKYLVAFVLGFSLMNGSLPIVAPSLAPLASNSVQSWKFYMAVPAVIVCLCLIRGWRPAIIGLFLVLLAIFSAMFDTRSITLLCLLTAGVVFLAGRTRGTGIQWNSISKSKLLTAAIILAVCTGIAIFIVEKNAEIRGLAERQSNSSLRRFAMAKTTFEIIKLSPYVGYGSWARDPQMAKAQEKMIEKLDAINTRGEQREDIIIAHSQLLQTWLEGGVIGMFFCLVLGFKLGTGLFNLALRYPYHALVPLYAFLLLHSSWHLVFSPFRGTQRIFIALACAILVRIAYDLSLSKTISHAREQFQNYWTRTMAPKHGYG